MASATIINPVRISVSISPPQYAAYTKLATFLWFPLLPGEVKNKVYYHYFSMGRPIELKRNTSDLTYYKAHASACPLGQHNASMWHPRRVPVETSTCQQPFSSQNIVTLPASRLSLLLVCKEVYAEAEDIFYKVNNFVFMACWKLEGFFGVTPLYRYKVLTELTINFTSTDATMVFTAMPKTVIS